MKSKCSICGKEIVVKQEHSQYGIKCKACKKKIAAKLAGLNGNKEVNS